MTAITSIISNEDELALLAKKLIDFAGKKKVFLFYGEMGTGKTTFIKQLCIYLGVQSGLSSPTYSIVNEYKNKNNTLIYHFDLYRLKNVQECVSIGMEDYLNSGNYCFIEWPGIAEQLYSNSSVKINISELNGVRTFIFE